jgi:hypothetical protein
MIGTPFVERPVQRPLVIEITVAVVQRHAGRWNGCENRSGTALDDFLSFPRRENNDFVAEARGSPEFGIDIGPDPAAVGAVKRANVDNPHVGRKPAKRREVQVKVF